MKKSYVTVTDQFCGAGGSSLGAASAGAEIRLALNHWRLAIETHNSNFPNTDHDCTDISACDPRRYPSTDILITSPECTNHSLAKGKRRNCSYYKQDLFGNLLIDPAEERSRATMWDVPRFAEYHDYRIIIVENVVDARSWVMWDAWLHAMQCLGYTWRCIYFNSMFAHPTPQSRDRLYVVFWKQGNRAPQLDLTPPAWCARCERDVEARQVWKRADRQYGRYGQRGQYLYCCPECMATVHPYYYPALTAIDWELPIERIGDRKKPLKESTLRRIQLGLERFGSQHLLIETSYSHALNNRAQSVKQPYPTQTSRQTLGLLSPYLIRLTGSASDPNGTIALTDPLGTQVAAGSQHALIVELRNHQTARAAMEALSTVAANGNHHGLLMPFLTSYYRATAPHTVDEPVATVTGTDKHALVMPFLMGIHTATSYRQIWEAAQTVVAEGNHHALIDPGITPAIDDCGFRMLEPHEVGRAMAFPDSYKVLGNKRERVKQYGNAVTPPVMQLLLERCLATLD